MGPTISQMYQPYTDRIEEAVGRHSVKPDPATEISPSPYSVKEIVRAASETVEKYPLYVVAALTVVAGIMMMIYYPKWSK